MERNPFVELSDDTTITYSDLKTKSNGEKYVTMYFETPTEKYGFFSMNIDYPGGTPQNVVGYSQEDIERLLYHYNKLGDLALDEAIKEAKGEHIYA